MLDERQAEAEQDATEIASGLQPKIVDVGTRLMELVTARARLQTELADVDSRIDEIRNLMGMKEPS